MLPISCTNSSLENLGSFAQSRLLTGKGLERRTRCGQATRGRGGAVITGTRNSRNDSKSSSFGKKLLAKLIAQRHTSAAEANRALNFL